MAKVINEIGNRYGMVTVNERGPNDNNVTVGKIFQPAVAI